MADDYEQLLIDYHIVRAQNAKLERKLDDFEKLMRKHNIGSIEKLDALLTWERRI